MSYENGCLSPSDVALLQGSRSGSNGDGGFGDNGAWWIILFLIFAMGGWNNNGGGFGGGFGGGSGSFNDGYAWLSNGQKEIMQNTNQGFNTLQLGNQLNDISNSVQGISTQLCGCCADMQQSLCNGFAGVNQTVNSGFANAETAANARQMANMNQNFTNAMNVQQGFNTLGSQMANCCCDIREGIAGVNYNNAIQTQTLSSQIATENCQDRAVLQEGVRDIITNATSNTQAVLDKLCQLELDAKNDKIDAKNEKIADLQRELQMADLRASQVAQNAFISQGFSNEVDQLYTRLNNCPVATVPVYRKTAYIHM